jgi:hypothetical protein
MRNSSRSYQNAQLLQFVVLFFVFKQCSLCFKASDQEGAAVISSFHMTTKTFLLRGSKRLEPQDLFAVYKE